MPMESNWTVSRSEVYSPKRLREFVLEAEEKRSGIFACGALHTRSCH
jgi:hypothetical protein